MSVLRVLLPVLFVCVCSIPGKSEPSVSAAVHCSSLLDPENDQVAKDVFVVIQGGLVASVIPASQVASIPQGAARIETGNGFCLPGLIDVHDHLTSEPKDSGYASLGVSVPRQTVVGVKNARVTLLAGFTTIRNVGAAGWSDVALRDGINAGEIAGPRMYVSGPPLGITGGHCDDNLLAPEFQHSEYGVADGPWAVRKKVREDVKYGADLIKVCASGGVLSKGDAVGAEQYTFEEMEAIAAEAHKLGRKVAAHAHGTEAIKDAIRAGIDSIEHSSLIDDEGIQLAKQHHTYLVFDIYNDTYILQEGLKVGMLPESIEKEKNVGKLQRANFRKAYLAGAPLAFGTDGGVYPHGDNAKQFAVMVEWGAKPIDAIRTSTTEAARLLNLQGRAGTVQAGSFADLIAVRSDPRLKIDELEHVRFVMKDGKVFKNDAEASKLAFR